MNEYERARLRYERISRSHPEITQQARAIIDWSLDEWEAAPAELRQYEVAPGIPLPAVPAGPAGGPVPGGHLDPHWMSSGNCTQARVEDREPTEEEAVAALKLLSDGQPHFAGVTGPGRAGSLAAGSHLTRTQPARRLAQEVEEAYVTQRAAEADQVPRPAGPRPG